MTAIADRNIVDLTNARYEQLVDQGHREFIALAAECEGFFSGRGQWEAQARQALTAQGKPVLTINQIRATVNYILGHQINSRTTTTFSPRRRGADDKTAETLSKVYRQIADNNQLDWVRSEVFADGIITGRGFYDVRLDFSDSLQGEVRITQLDPRQVLPDADSGSYDPKDWKDVLTVQFLSIDDIEVVWGKPTANKVRVAFGSKIAGYDQDIASTLDKRGFGSSAVEASTHYHVTDTAPIEPVYGAGLEGTSESLSRFRRVIPVIERQWRKLTKVRQLMYISTGDVRSIPEDMTEEQIQTFITDANGAVRLIERLDWRIRWTVVAGDVLLHDKWSPYNHFTVVPYFPMFRRGATVGAVEDLRDPQRLLNKTVSQEVHILNTTANSGWKVKTGTLTNMSIAELEQRGGETGLIVEVNEMDGLEKILPNQIPSGIDRMAYQANEFIKQISGISDYMRGSAREDVAAKAVVANQQTGSIGITKSIDNLQMTDKILATVVLSIVQMYYTDERVLRVMVDTMKNTSEDVMINQSTPDGIVNDLTVGEYDIIVTSVPARELDEDNEFEQALRMKLDAGIQIPDDFLIRTSRLREKSQLLDTMRNTSEAAAQQQQQVGQLDMQKLQAEVQKLQAEAVLKNAQAQSTLSPTATDGATGQMETAKMQMEFELRAKEIQLDAEIKLQELQMKRQEHEQKMLLEQSKMAQQAEMERSRQRMEHRARMDAANSNPLAAPSRKTPMTND